jgi:hypothetical protein
MSTESKPSNSTESKPNNSLEILSLLFSSINKNHEAKKSLETIKNSDNISSDIFEQSIQSGFKNAFDAFDEKEAAEVLKSGVKSMKEAQDRFGKDIVVNPRVQALFAEGGSLYKKD